MKKKYILTAALLIVGLMSAGCDSSEKKTEVVTTTSTTGNDQLAQICERSLQYIRTGLADYRDSDNRETTIAKKQIQTVLAEMDHWVTVCGDKFPDIVASMRTAKADLEQILSKEAK